jgi:hypothetical protein
MVADKRVDDILYLGALGVLIGSAIEVSFSTVIVLLSVKLVVELEVES